ncbi:NACHT domain-containing protein [Streptomyces sp. 7N604]|uniref:NACHT domain-containing protein n=1 Tax=Streptomyces sp. 7N604 TaxID=3457415 RepID=UPI003FD34C0D
MRRGGYRRGPKRVGLWFLLWLVLTAVAALVLVRYFGMTETAATWLLGLPIAYLAWKAFYHDRVEAAAVDLETAAGQLAEAVKRQWDAEAAIRRVNDPYPLPVAWRPADADLVEPWELLTDVARAWPGGPPGDPADWPGDTAGLAGADGQIGEVFTQRVPTRRLVVLGEPGSGKTMLLIRLLQGLIEQRSDGGLVPVLFSLASWNPTHECLTGWLAEQLRRSHPGLRALAPPTAPEADPVDLAQAILEGRRILPILDGFDELPAALHAMALDALNRALPAKQPLVVASRAAAYRDALTRPDATVVRLNGAAGIHLLPLTADEAAAYLRRDAGGERTPAADRWNTVATHLGTDTPVGQALSTPLGLFLARTIYNPRPHTPAAPGPVPHPDELCDITTFPTRTALNTHLFKEFIPAAYTPRHPRPPRWPATQAHRTFIFLARHLETNRDSSPDLAWWELHHAIPASVRRRTFEWVTAQPVSTSSAQLRWSADLLTFRFAFALALGLAGGLAYGLTYGLSVGLGIGVAGVLVFGFVGGIEAEKPDLTTMVGPAALLTQDRRSFFAVGLRSWLIAGLMFGLAGGLLDGLLGGFADGLGVGLTGVLVGVLMFGPLAGLESGLVETAWGGWVVARAYLAMRRKVPWDLMTFLQDAHEHRGVLRQVGAVYQFRHLDLQRHLAQHPWPPPPDNPHLVRPLHRP